MVNIIITVSLLASLLSMISQISILELHSRKTRKKGGLSNRDFRTFRGKFLSFDIFKCV